MVSRKLTEATFAVLLFAGCGLVALESRSSRSLASNSTHTQKTEEIAMTPSQLEARNVPPIDRAIPRVVETATFACG